jgi:hypothetical protein
VPEPMISGPGTRHRLRLALGTSVAIGITLLVVSGAVYGSPTSRNSRPGPYVAPFSGSPVTVTFVNGGLCPSDYTDSQIVAPAFNVSSGFGVYDERSTARNGCGEQDVLVGVMTSVGLSTSLNLSYPHTYVITADWTLNFTVEIRSHPAPGQYGSPSAKFSVYVENVLNGQVYGKSVDGTPIEESVTNGVYRETFTDQRLTCTLPVRLHKDDGGPHWGFSTFIVVQTWVSVPGKGDWARAQVDLGTGGLGATLVSYSYVETK